VTRAVGLVAKLQVLGQDYMIVPHRPTKQLERCVFFDLGLVVDDRLRAVVDVSSLGAGSSEPETILGNPKPARPVFGARPRVVLGLDVDGMSRWYSPRLKNNSVTRCQNDLILIFPIEVSRDLLRLQVADPAGIAG
jgi:hypothetical protein